MSDLLPFTSLRAFAAVARTGSFSEAAAVLGVSQSAVSQQVKSLEVWIGQPLLRRAARGATPTPEGRALAEAIEAGFGQVARECARLRERGPRARSVTIGCLPGFAYIWLFPRLLNFDIAYPDIALSVSTSINALGLPDRSADVIIRYSDTPAPGLVNTPLIGEQAFPVCAPSLLEGPPPLRNLQDLARHTLLLDEYHPHTKAPPTWQRWADAHGLHLPKPAKTRTFGQSNLVLHAAISGLGVALGRTPLVNGALAEGTLVRPFAQELRSASKYWVVCEEAALADPRCAAFIQWIRAEAAATPAPPARA